MPVTKEGEASVGWRIVSQTSEATGSEAHAVFAISEAPAGRGLSMVTAKLRVTWAPARREERASVQVEPAPEPGVQDQPGELPAAEKTV